MSIRAQTATPAIIHIGKPSASHHWLKLRHSFFRKSRKIRDVITKEIAPTANIQSTLAIGITSARQRLECERNGGGCVGSRKKDPRDARGKAQTQLFCRLFQCLNSGGKCS